MTQMTNVNDKVRSNDRILMLEAIDGKTPLRASGLIDQKIFTGENRLHAVMDEQTSLWKLKYEKGIVPPVFDQRFTSFTKLMDFVTPYMKRRNLKISEVKD